MITASLLRLPSFGLLLSLAALVLIEPIAERLRGGVLLLAVLHLGVLVLAVRCGVAHAGVDDWLTWLLAAPTIALNLAYLFVDHPALSIANLAMLAVFYAYVIRCLLGYVLRDAVVTIDELFAATCTYVLIALVFACLYTIEDSSLRARSRFRRHRSVRQPALLRSAVLQLHGAHQHRFRRHPPAGPRRRGSIVIVEQVMGVMYVAILIARLTGMNLVRTPAA